jgi:hypothetical protein
LGRDVAQFRDLTEGEIGDHHCCGVADKLIFGNRSNETQVSKRSRYSGSSDRTDHETPKFVTSMMRGSQCVSFCRDIAWLRSLPTAEDGLPA